MRRIVFATAIFVSVFTSAEAAAQTYRNATSEMFRVPPLPRQPQVVPLNFDLSAMPANQPISYQSDDDGLLKLLVKKGVITQQEMERIEGEQSNDTEDTDEQQPSVGYEKGAYIKTQGDKHELHFRFLFQAWFETTDVYGGETESTFLIRHAQLRLFGHILDPRLKYKMMIDGAARSRADDIELRDLWADWQWTDAFQIKFGQFLVWFDFENITPVWALHFVDRSIINAALGFERDAGVQLHGHLFDDRVQYYLFTMNGEGRNTINAGNDMIYAGRVDVHLLGEEQYLVPDLPTSCEPHLAWGTAFMHDTANANAGGDRLNRFTSELVFRYRGFSALGLVNCVRNEDNQQTDFGFLGEAGCFVVPERLEVACRVAEINREGAISAALADPREATIGVNYYFNEHQVKLQADYSQLWNDRSIADRDAQRVRVQLQLFF